MKRHGHNQQRLIFVRDLIECCDQWSVLRGQHLAFLTTDPWPLATRHTDRLRNHARSLPARKGFQG